MGPGNIVFWAAERASYGLTASIAHMMRLAWHIVRFGAKKLLAAAVIVLTSGSPALPQTTAVSKHDFPTFLCSAQCLTI